MPNTCTLSSFTSRSVFRTFVLAVCLIFSGSLLLPGKLHAGPDMDTLVRANQLLYTGQYLSGDGNDGAMELYSQLLQSSEPEAVSGAQKGIGAILRLAVHYAADDDKIAWPLAEAVLNIEDASLREAIQNDLTAYADIATELATEAQSSGRCSTALRQTARALKAIPEHDQAKAIQSKIRANPGYVSVVAQPDGKVFLNGRDKGTTPLLNTKLTCGRYRVEIKSDGMKTRKGYVSIRPGHLSKIIWKFNASEPTLPNPVPYKP